MDARPHQKDGDSETAEYIIATLDKPAPPEENGAEEETETPSVPEWQESSRTKDMDEAVKSARKLYDSGDYAKVAVRKEYFDADARKRVIVDVHIHGEKGNEKISIAAFVVLSLFAGIASFLLTYFIVKYMSGN